MSDIEKELMNLADANYKEFNQKICSDTKKELLGVRIPKLKKLAKEIAKSSNWQNLLNSIEDNYFEEIILQGLIIGYSKITFEEKIPLIKIFISKADSWAITDTFTPTLKLNDADLENAFNFIRIYFSSKNEFEVRFAIIMILDYFLIDDYIDEVIQILDKINHDGYYVKMAVAWCLAEIGVKYNDKLMKYLNSKNNLDKFTYNKTLQKMIESFRISDEQKIILRKMKKH